MNEIDTSQPIIKVRFNVDPHKDPPNVDLVALSAIIGIIMNYRDLNPEPGSKCTIYEAHIQNDH